MRHVMSWDSWAELGRRVGQGDSNAEAELAHWFHPRIRVFASARLHGSDAAADVAQDTIVAVIRALRGGRVREPEHLPAFVLGVAANLINSLHRASTLRREIQMDPPPDPPVNDPIIDRLDFAQRRALVRVAFTHVSKTDRRILTLTMVEGLQPREIAPIVGLSADVVRTHKSRAVRAMTEALRARDRKPPARPLMTGEDAVRT